MIETAIADRLSQPKGASERESDCLAAFLATNERGSRASYGRSGRLRASALFVGRENCVDGSEALVPPKSSDQAIEPVKRHVDQQTQPDQMHRACGGPQARSVCLSA